MATKILSGDHDTYSVAPWRVSNNVWNPGTLVNGRDYTQTIKFDPSHIASGTDISWNWPAGHDVHAYPYIGWSGLEGVQVQNLQTLNVSFDYAKSGAGVANIAFDTWVTHNANDPWSSGYEVMVTLNPWGTTGAQMETMKDGSLNLNLYVYENWGSGWTFAQAVSTTTVTSGSFDMADVFKTLVWDGVLTGDEYLHEIQFGAEVVSGSGKLHISSLAYQPTTASTITGTAGDDWFLMSTSGGQHVDGGAGNDTAIFGGMFADFQVKVANSGDTMVVHNHSVSTLDTLSGVETLQFTDGTYDTASHFFHLF